MLKLRRLPIADYLLRFLRDDRGATAIEYAMIASGIAVAVASVVFGLGSQLNNNFYGNVAAALK